MSLYRNPTIVINDLKEICVRCRGSGHQPGFSTLGVSQINYDGRCPTCAGRGYRLTELGEDFLNLFRPFLQEMIDGPVPSPSPVEKPLPVGKLSPGGKKDEKDSA